MAEEIDGEVEDGELEPEEGTLPSSTKAWSWRLFSLALGVGAVLPLFVIAMYLFKNGEHTAQNKEALAQWQSAYAVLVAKSEKCVGTKVAQQILEDTVSGWPAFKTEEATVVFSDWRGEMRGMMLAGFLRTGDKTETERIADARGHIEATHKVWSD
jgi:4-amino-4-deoxy-L-arabinose transferase-like glycosyltransferase